MKTYTAILILSLLYWSSNPLFATTPIDVSLIQLIANPADYDGKVVRVIGFLRLEFEGNAVYLHQDDYTNSISKNGLWIEITNDMRKKKADFDQKYVMLEGTFNAEMKGHLGLWSGSIQDISRVLVWEKK